MENEKIDFAEAAEHALKLKELRRTGWLSHGTEDCKINSRPREMQTAKSIRMALIHDMEENLSGDIVTRQKESMKINNTASKERKLLGKAVGHLGDDFTGLLDDFNEAELTEDSIISEIDKFDMILQARSYQKKYGKNLEDFEKEAASKIKQSELTDTLEG